MSLWKTLGLDRLATPGSGAASGDRTATETVRRIVAELNRLEPERARYIAAFAYILSRVAHADLEISDVETLAMERAVRDLGGLREEEAILVVQMAKTQALLFGSTENFLVTREFGRVATPEQKRSLLECLFAVSAADDTITSVEEAEIRRIVSELDLGHGDFIAARSQFLRYVAVLKEREPPAS